MKASIILIPAITLSAVLAGCGGGPAKPSGNAGANVVSPFHTEAQLIARVAKSTVKLVGTVGKDTSEGSGVIVDASRSLVLTNAHVISGVVALKVVLNDGTDVAGRVLAQAPCDDLAVVEITQKPAAAASLVALPLGDSATLQAGDNVTALGYPTSLQQSGKEKPSATEGIVSALDIGAEFDASLPKYVSLIQHQAPINPGNSGGPLVDDHGRLVGINTLANTLANGRAIQGQYYAISVNHIKQLLPTLSAGKSSSNLGWDIIPNSPEVVSSRTVDLRAAAGVHGSDHSAAVTIRGG
jgi:serine protease Do